MSRHTRSESNRKSGSGKRSISLWRVPDDGPHPRHDVGGGVAHFAHPEVSEPLEASPGGREARIRPRAKFYEPSATERSFRNVIAHVLGTARRTRPGAVRDETISCWVTNRDPPRTLELVHDLSHLHDPTAVGGTSVVEQVPV